MVVFTLWGGLLFIVVCSYTCGFLCEFWIGLCLAVWLLLLIAGGLVVVGVWCWVLGGLGWVCV